MGKDKKISNKWKFSRTHKTPIISRSSESGRFAREKIAKEIGERFGRALERLSER